MTHNSRPRERRAVELLREVLNIETDKPGALPGRVVRHVKEALAHLRKDLKGNARRDKAMVND